MTLEKSEGVKLKRFSEQVRSDWVKSGYSTVKITGSEHLDDKVVPDLLYVLVEPLKRLDNNMGNCDMIAPISSYVVTSIINRNAGLARTKDVAKNG